MRITDCSPETAAPVQHLQPSLVSVHLHRVEILNPYLCGILLCMPKLTSLKICHCPGFDDRVANLLLARLVKLKEVYFEELFEMKELDYSLSPVKIQELYIQKCPRLLFLNPNHYLLKCIIRQTILTGKNIEDIVKISVCLQELVVEECRNVQVLTVRSTSLLKLIVARCLLLEYLKVETPALREISASQCYRLVHVDVDAPLLKSFALPHLPALSALFVTSTALRRLDLTGCLRLYQSVLAIRATAKSPNCFAVSRNCMMSGKCDCRPHHSQCYSGTDQELNIDSIDITAHTSPCVKSHRRCFHYDRISLCCPKLKIKPTSLVFPMHSPDVDKTNPDAKFDYHDDRKARRESL